ncbi:hypothetical protein AVEN_92830-1 [Araneus ventricosus]|uniref:Uncharacterized protein n=1 Tax=Araneus ventricosus TaxID=182803 RepID=A0A4Y2IUX9_ARAVE|nr:hypothetical protein AVEN_92830-1 [Araneus ventricosus]
MRDIIAKKSPLRDYSRAAQCVLFGLATSATQGNKILIVNNAIYWQVAVMTIEKAVFLRSQNNAIYWQVAVMTVEKAVFLRSQRTISLPPLLRVDNLFYAHTGWVIGLPRRRKVLFFCSQNRREDSAHYTGSSALTLPRSWFHQILCGPGSFMHISK